jgi:hypothetical protein
MLGRAHKFCNSVSTSQSSQKSIVPAADIISFFQLKMSDRPTIVVAGRHAGFHSKDTFVVQKTAQRYLYRLLEACARF